MLLLQMLFSLSIFLIVPILCFALRRRCVWPLSGKVDWMIARHTATTTFQNTREHKKKCIIQKQTTKPIGYSSTSSLQREKHEIMYVDVCSLIWLCVYARESKKIADKLNGCVNKKQWRNKKKIRFRCISNWKKKATNVFFLRRFSSIKM